jgi:TonB dependent receptor/TonB-dependent Receptor Plug Domain
VLEELRSTGVEVVYSSELVPNDLPAQIPASATTPMQRAVAALAAQRLRLKPIGAKQYAVVRDESAVTAAPVASPPAAHNDTLEEVSVYASRYSIEGQQPGGPRLLGPTDIQRVPGAQDDPVRALRTLPGVATNASARPYIRGSLTDDVLISFDDVTLLDPFHFKNFQDLVSAINPAAVARMEVFSGGFPVQYGTRSSGVVDIIPASIDQGYENTASLSLLAAGVSTVGHADTLPLDWLATVRRSTIDLALGAVDSSVGTPAFADSMGRVRWRPSDRSDWTVGWLLLDDRLALDNSAHSETSNARYRDEYAWLALRSRLGDSWTSRTTLAYTSSRRSRFGDVATPGVVMGTVMDLVETDSADLTSHWIFTYHGQPLLKLGAGIATSTSDYQYDRQLQMAPYVAAAFSRAPVDSISASGSPSSVTYFAYASAHQKWSKLEAELGVRLDGQDYSPGSSAQQLSPRLNLRYDLAPAWRAYGSVGAFTQAQRVEEWRAEEGQQLADPAMLAIHSVVGISYAAAADAQYTLELYDKRWTRSKPYFDNLLDPLVLIPDLGPDRVRIAPLKTEAAGMELSVHKVLSDSLDASGTLAWSNVADEFPNSEQVRSWNQPLAMTAGISWNSARANISALAGWHQGWPRTPVATVAGPTPALVLGIRNSENWNDYWTLDLRAGWRQLFAAGELSYFVEVTNSTNHENDCCTRMESPVGGVPELEVTDWLPLLVNLGFTFRWHGDGR